MMITKVCTKCGVEKPLDEYSKGRRYKYGVRAQCKVCIKHSASAYYKRNRDKFRENSRRWAMDNPDKARERSRRWRLNNPEKFRKIQSKWRRNNHEKFRGKVRRWQRNNPEKVREMNRKNVEGLVPSYVKSLIIQQYNIDTTDITPETIEMKRRSIKYYRELNQLKKLTK